jgi:hypothetical protein
MANSNTVSGNHPKRLNALLQKVAFAELNLSETAPATVSANWRTQAMDGVMSLISEVFRDLLVFIAVMTSFLVALIVIIANLSPDNPLKRLLTALALRVGATAAAGALAIPIEPFPASMSSTTSGRQSCSCSIGFLFSG